MKTQLNHIQRTFKLEALSTLSECPIYQQYDKRISKSCANLFNLICVSGISSVTVALAMREFFKPLDGLGHLDMNDDHDAECNLIINGTCFFLYKLNTINPTFAEFFVDFLFNPEIGQRLDGPRDPSEIIAFFAIFQWLMKPLVSSSVAFLWFQHIDGLEDKKNYFEVDAIAYREIICKLLNSIKDK